jgi:octaprenyl-diphosphate synthase
MGKNLGDDLREGKTTLPLIFAMQRGTPAQRELIRAAIEAGRHRELGKIVEIVRETGALDSRAAAAAEAQRAIHARVTDCRPIRTLQVWYNWRLNCLSDVPEHLS